MINAFPKLRAVSWNSFVNRQWKDVDKRWFPGSCDWFACEQIKVSHFSFVFKVWGNFAFCTWPCFETEAKGNSEITYWQKWLGQFALKMLARFILQFTEGMWLPIHTLLRPTIPAKCVGVSAATICHSFNWGSVWGREFKWWDPTSSLRGSWFSSDTFALGGWGALSGWPKSQTRGIPTVSGQDIYLSTCVLPEW